ncbi:hypothetical protein PPYR_09967 [Photinus pyralis]|uniref:Sugar phosphate transporter domain-containing protein n=1 Tax=Photinus pyralis TaxID=7054 RepID=A0A1Y1KHE0_PHOPY|nr:hypothetical protein PPYR_09967 [Photinus pyralis]
MVGRRQKYEVVNCLPDEENDLEVKTQKLLTTQCLWYSFRNILLISIYFFFSIGLTFYQRWLYQSFRFPLSVVIVHLIVKYLLASIIRTILIKQQGKPRVTLTFKEYFIAVSPTGIFSGIDIGFSNWGLELVTVSLYTMTKSTSIVFILFFAILLKLEKKSWSLCTIVIMISLGLFLFTYQATQFSIIGFILLILASASSGVRWTCTQLLLQKSKMGMKNPIDMIYYMQPWMIVSVLPFAVGMEGISLITNCQLFRNADYIASLDLCFKILLGAVIAFLMECAEVMVISHTSSLTLAIAGIFKELLLLTLAVVVNGDHISAINAIGLLLCLLGIVGHVIHKVRTVQHISSLRLQGLEEDKFEVSESLINNSTELVDISSDNESELSDSQVLFDIINRRGGN